MSLTWCWTSTLTQLSPAFLFMATLMTTCTGLTKTAHSLEIVKCILFWILGSQCQACLYMLCSILASVDNIQQILCLFINVSPGTSGTLSSRRCLRKTVMTSTATTQSTTRTRFVVCCCCCCCCCFYCCYCYCCALATSTATTQSTTRTRFGRVWVRLP